MAKEKGSREGQAAPAAERRNQPRAASRVGNDWESIALRRVARHVRALPGIETDGEEERPDARVPGGFGWEEAVLRNLRQRLKDRDSS